MLFSKQTVTWMFIAGVFGLIVYASFQSTYRLKRGMPTAFMDDGRSWSPQKRAQEEKLAPPPEVLVTVKDVGTAASDTGSRMRYWQNLGRVWNQPASWEKSYGFDLNSMGTSLQAAGTRLELFLRRVTRASW